MKSNAFSVPSSLRLKDLQIVHLPNPDLVKTRSLLSRVSNLLSEFERVPPCSLEGCAPDGRAIELNLYLPSSPQVTNSCSALRQADCDNESDDGSDTGSGCDDSSNSSAHDAHLDESKSDECTDHGVRNHPLVEELPSQQVTSDSRCE
ncbi:hypothetical protein CRM22_008040 [Opisthorchis felineus]|uniref:Uncharacterized protein n=1 Tax=Opisthorchis felineus TaxID=147828 RepID=A0A4S2LL08_OPIFE|nr:hypothetical protein CRM22_008040 [Opisthorchis felineus]